MKNVTSVTDNDLTSRRTSFIYQTLLTAGQLAESVQRDLTDDFVSRKSDLSPVTIADLSVQAFIGYTIQHSEFQTAFVAEEDGSAFDNDPDHHRLHLVHRYVQQVLPGITESETYESIESARAGTGTEPSFWLLDPIDGTKGFIRKDQYAIALALIEHGEVCAGGLGCPNLPIEMSRPNSPRGVIMTACKGYGTLRFTENSSGLKTHVSSVNKSSDIRILRSFEDSHTNGEQIELINRRLGITVPPVRMDSQAKYALLASGDAEVLLRIPNPNQPERKEKIWDQAAGVIVLEEAGGRASDLDGNPLVFGLGRELTQNNGICSTNGLVHDLIIDAYNAG